MVSEDFTANILFLSEMFYPHGSGAELATQLYAELLSKSGVNVAVVTNRFSGESSYSKFGSLTIHRLPLFRGTSAVKYSIMMRFDVLFSNFLKKMLEWADVVYIPRFWFSAIALAKSHRKPVIVHLHDYISICSLSTSYDETIAATCRKSAFCSPKCVYLYEKAHDRSLRETLTSIILNTSVGHYAPKLIRLADAVVCVSKKQKEIITEKERSLRRKTHVVYNPVPAFPDNKIDGNDFGYFGGSDVLKGVVVLRNALTHLQSNSVKPIRIHCTKFHLHDKNNTKTLNALGLVPYDKLNKTDFEKMYRNVKCVVVPSLWHEPWPYVIVEALLRGRYVVASRIGGIPEQTEGCKGSSLFPPGEHKALADSLESVNALSREQIINLGYQNRDTFLRRFNNDSSTRSFINLCEGLI